MVKVAEGKLKELACKIAVKLVEDTPLEEEGGSLEMVAEDSEPIRRTKEEADMLGLVDRKVKLQVVDHILSSDDCTLVLVARRNSLPG